MRKWIVRATVGTVSLALLVAVAWVSYFLGALQSYDHFAAFDGFDTVVELQMLRRGDVDHAIEALEQKLDNRIIIHRGFSPTLAHWMDASGLTTQSTDCTMWRIAEYRLAHPSSWPDEHVRSALRDELRRYNGSACKRK